MPRLNHQDALVLDFGLVLVIPDYVNRESVINSLRWTYGLRVLASTIASSIDEYCQRLERRGWDVAVLTTTDDAISLTKTYTVARRAVEYRGFTVLDLNTDALANKVASMLASEARRPRNVVSRWLQQHRELTTPVLGRRPHVIDVSFLTPDKAAAQVADYFGVPAIVNYDTTEDIGSAKVHQ